jgi:hypothetical protein
VVCVVAVAVVVATGGVLVAASARGLAGAGGPDPAVQAGLDGCTRHPVGQLTRLEPEWVYVGDKGAPAAGPPPAARWASGIVSSGGSAELASHPTGVDLPVTHDSYDFTFNLRVDPAYAFLLGGERQAGTGNFEGNDEERARLHLERESRAFPLFAWPEGGDRVSVLGNWIWDCGHWQPGGERTEFHPFRVLWLQRNPLGAVGGASPRSPFGESEGDLFASTVATPAGISADCAHQTKGDQAAFKACLLSAPNWQDVSGRYQLQLSAPPKPSPGAKLTVRIVDAGSSPGVPPLQVRREAHGVSVSVQLASTPGQRLLLAKEVFVGWTPLPASSLPEHLRLSFHSLLIRRAMDPGCQQAGCTTPETTNTDQISQPPGEWNLYWDVAGIWNQWQPIVLRVHDGELVPVRQSVDFYLARNAPWRVLLTGRECDFGALSFSNPQQPPWPCPPSNEFGSAAGDDVPGTIYNTYPTPTAGLGTHHANAQLTGSTCPPINRHGCYAVTYNVQLINDAPQRATHHP